ncbi:Putative Phosphoglucomutase phosphomannomutase [Rhizopus microsporus]|nr:Putative Phosphoglucomutase phosphomannomutase [Rhizopus microsporus]
MVLQGPGPYPLSAIYHQETERCWWCDDYCLACNTEPLFDSCFILTINPKDDNGYKVYWENACQIIPPHDEGIALAIMENLTPWVWDYEAVNNSDLVSDPTDQGIIDSYFEEIFANTDPIMKQHKSSLCILPCMVLVLPLPSDPLSALDCHHLRL